MIETNRGNSIFTKQKSIRERALKPISFTGWRMSIPTEGYEGDLALDEINVYSIPPANVFERWTISHFRFHRHFQRIGHHRSNKDREIKLASHVCNLCSWILPFIPLPNYTSFCMWLGSMESNWHAKQFRICCQNISVDSDYLVFYVPLKNFSLIRRRHHYWWRTAKFKPMLGAQGLWAERDLYRATPAVTQAWGLGFSGLIRRIALSVASLRHTRGFWGSILTQILMGPHSYDTQGGAEDLF
jgi:hypothetical protein